MPYFENDGNTPAENATNPDAGNGNGSEENHLDGGLTEEDEEFLEQVESKDVDDMTADERDHLKELLGKAKTTIGQKKHYKTKFEEASQELERLKPAPKPKTEIKNTEARPAAKSDDDKIRYQKLEFRQDNSGLTKDQVEEIFTYAALKRVTPEEALKSNFIKKYLEQSAADREAEGASGHPSSGGAAHVKAKGENFKTMDSKAFNARRAQIMRGRR